MKEISGDISKTYRPSLTVKLWYLVYNLGRGIIGSFSLVRTQQWQPESINSTNHQSPMRVLSDKAFSHVIDENVDRKNISVLDIGAGSAYLREVLAQKGYQGSYTGVDVYRHQSYSDDAVPQFTSQLIISKIEDFQTEQKFDLVMSLTALEHIPDDFTAIKVATKATAPGGTQIHIVPGFWSLFMYLLHGYRQYTRRRLGQLFSGQNYRIYRLGGLPSLLVHVFCITILERIFNRPIRHHSFYPRLVNRAIKLDRWLPICGYAFVIVVEK